MKKKLIGEIGIDSGQVLICDPGYLNDWEHTEYPLKGLDPQVRTHAFNYDGACKETLLAEGNAGELRNGWAVVAESGYGDGCYPVYAEYNEDGRIMKIIIDFNDHRIMKGRI